MSSAEFALEDTKAPATRRPIVRYVHTGVRVLVGLLFLVSGLNGFFNFLPQPTEPMPEGAVALAGAFIKSGYMFPLIAGAEAVAGALLLANRFVPLALTLLAPVLVNIFAFHLVLARAGLGMAIVLLVAEAFLAWGYRDLFRPMLAMRATPGAK